MAAVIHTKPCRRPISNPTELSDAATVIMWHELI